jgi:hypothetical protein
VLNPSSEEWAPDALVPVATRVTRFNMLTGQLSGVGARLVAARRCDTPGSVCGRHAGYRASGVALRGVHFFVCWQPHRRPRRAAPRERSHTYTKSVTEERRASLFFTARPAPPEKPRATHTERLIIRRYFILT